MKKILASILLFAMIFNSVPVYALNDIPSTGVENYPNANGADGTAQNPYIINEAADFEWIVSNFNEVRDKNFIQTCNIDLSNYYTTNGSDDKPKWQPIGGFGGEKMASFIGNFDGQGYELTNLYFNSSFDSDTTRLCDVGMGGLFGLVGNDTMKSEGETAVSATIKNVNLSGTFIADATINVGYTIGGITAYADGSVIEGCSFTGSIDTTCNSNIGGGEIGGIVGYASSKDNNFKILNCSNQSDISVDGDNANVGGMLGVSYCESPLIISDCFNSGNISFVNRPHKVYNYEPYTGQDKEYYKGNVGGIVGSSEQTVSGDISSCFNKGILTPSENNSITFPNNVTNDCIYYVGSIFGKEKVSNTYSDCYYLEGNVADAIGDAITTSNLPQAQNDSFFKDSSNFTGWNSWILDDGSYPALRKVPQVSTASSNDVTPSTATISANVSSNGDGTLAERGISYRISTGEFANQPADTVDIGAYAVNLSGLSDDTTYFARAYAINEMGTSYGEPIKFTTSEVGSDITKPILSMESASEISQNATTLNFTSNEAGTYYYLVLLAGDTAPNASVVEAQGTAVAKGTSTSLASVNTASVTGLAESTSYKAYVIVKDVEGNVSEVSTIDFSTTAAPDETKPIITAGDVNRTSDTEATVKFTSNEDGSYYYDVVEVNASHNIDTSGAGTPCTTAETTITNPTNLTVGDKDIYIIVKDAAGNESDPFKMEIDAYVDSAPPIATVQAITGTLQVGETLTGHYTYSDVNGDLQGTSTFKWYRSDDVAGLNKAVISGATLTTYELQSGDIGKYISFEVTPVAETGIAQGIPVLSAWTVDVVLAEASVPFYIGNALHFADSNDSLYGGILTTQIDNVTMEAWVKADTLSSAGTAIRVMYNGNSSTSGYGIYLFGANKNPVILMGNVGFWTTDVTLTAGKWYHLVAVREGSWKFYVNGVERTLTPLYNPNSYQAPIAPITGQEFSIGNSSVANENFTGTIDEVRFWNVARTSEQISNNMNVKLQGNESGLLAYYNFDQVGVIPNGDNTGITTVTDVSSNGKSLNLTGFSLNGNTSNFIQGAGVFQLENSSYSEKEDIDCVKVAITRTLGDLGDVIINYSTSNGSAIAGTNYSSANGSVTFASGETRKEIDIPILKNGITSTKNYTISLSGIQGVAFGTNSSSTINILPSDKKAITAFDFKGLSPNVIGTVNEGAKSIALTVPYGTNVTALVPTIVHTGASISPETGEAQNFTDLVTYTVTGADSSEQEYTVTVTEAASSNSTLSNLSLSSGTLSPTFASGTTSYTASVGNGVSSITVTPTVAESNATVTVNGTTLTSGGASGEINLSVGANTITVVVTAQDGTTANTYTVTVTRAGASSGGSSSGGSSGGTTATTTQPSQTTSQNTVVVVNGKEQNAGKETQTTEGGKSTVTVAVENKAVESKIDEAIKTNITGIGNVIQVPVADIKSEVAKVELTGDIVKKLEQNAFEVSVKRDNVEYVIPAEEFTISKVAENLGLEEKNLADIKVEVKITKLDEKAVEKYNEVAKANGAELVFPPVQFEITAITTKTDGTTQEQGINKFSNYVERVMEIPAGVDPSKITTGIVFNADGTYSHVPTEVYQKDGKWYAKLNSLTNSNYSVIWNPVTVNSVENHWAKETVNDMASRLVIFNSEKFEPNKAITRADFAEYIVRALGLYREGSIHENNFKDVSATGERTLAILIANEYGIVSGYSDGTFRGDNQITREEAMVMYQRAMKITKLAGSDDGRCERYTDYRQVSDWAKTNVKNVLSAHVFNGTTATTISPKANLTYAESAQAIKNLLVESKLISQ